MDIFPEDETGNTLREFQKHGFDLSRPMEIDFFVAVPSKSAGEKVALKAQALGFQVSVEQDDETKEWTCYWAKKMILNYHDIVSIENDLMSISKPLGGCVDGFGTYGNV